MMAVISANDLGFINYEKTKASSQFFIKDIMMGGKKYE